MLPQTPSDRAWRLEKELVVKPASHMGAYRDIDPFLEGQDLLLGGWVVRVQVCRNATRLRRKLVRSELYNLGRVMELDGFGILSGYFLSRNSHHEGRYIGSFLEARFLGPVPEHGKAVESRQHLVLDIRNPIVVQCPSGLFVVVGEGDGLQGDVEPALDALVLVRMVSHCF